MLTPKSGPLLTIPQVAAILGISPRSVRRVIERGDLIVIRISDRMIRISPTELRDFVNRSHQGSE